MTLSNSNRKYLRWFEVAEYGSLAGAFAGLLYQQVLCVPLLAVFIWLSQKNRHRMEEATARHIAVSTRQVQEQVTQRITAIEQSTLIPDVYLKLSDAASIQEQIGQLQHKLSHVSDHINKLPPTPSDLTEVERKIERLSEGLGVMHSLDLASLFEKVTQVQQPLPTPTPFNPVPVQQDIDTLRTQVQSLQQLVESQKESVTSEQVENIASLEHQLQDYLTIKDFASWQKKVVASEVVTIQRKIEEIDRVVISLKNKLQTSLTKDEFLLWQQSAISLDELSAVKEQVVALANKVENRPKLNVQKQLDTLRGHVKQLEEHLTDLDHSYQDLHDETRPLEQMQNQLEILASSKDNSTDFESLLKEFSERFQGQVDESLETHLSAVNQMLKNIQPNYEYKLVCDRSESRKYLEKALDEVGERLIMVCPWLATYSIDSTIEEKIEAKLKKEININIGWGHLNDISKNSVRYGVGELWQRLKKHSNLYDAIDYLRDLEGDYLKLKIIGTHEKYIVCDRKFAVVGSHNFLTSGDSSKEREAGLFTTDPRIINELIKRFDEAKDLESKALSVIKSFPSSSNSLIHSFVDDSLTV